MAKKYQSNRLTAQHELSLGVLGIFNEQAKDIDKAVGSISKLLKVKLEEKYTTLEFRYRTSILKSEINEAMKKIDDELGTELFVLNSNIKPDGGIIEVKDDKDNWRVVLVSEAKHQGKDVENIKKGKLVGTKKNQDLMVAGNAIERSHKNICEIANYMLAESHFPYVIFLAGSNFLTKNINVTRPDGRVVTLNYRSGALNRLDRLSASNYGMPFNKNLCENKTISYEDKSFMLQSASIYTKGDGSSWNPIEMFEIMEEIAEKSIQMLSRDIFIQLTKNMNGCKNNEKE